MAVLQPGPSPYSVKIAMCLHLAQETPALGFNLHLKSTAVAPLPASDHYKHGGIRFPALRVRARTGVLGLQHQNMVLELEPHCTLKYITLSLVAGTSA